MSNVARSAEVPATYDLLKFVYDGGNNPGEPVEWLPESVFMSLEIDNSAGTELVFVKLFDSASTPTLGGTAPTLSLPCAAGATVSYMVADEVLQGNGPYFTDGIWYTISTEGGSAGTASDIPTTAPTVRMLARTV